MLRAAVIFFILAIVAVIFGAYGVAGLSMEIGKLLLIVFLVFAVITFIGGMFHNKRNNISHNKGAKT